METIIFGLGGFASLFLGVLIKKKHSDFIKKSIKVPGKIVNIVEITRKTRGLFGQVTDINYIKAPIVQYKYNKLYEFQSETDAKSHSLTTGSDVDVFIEFARPNVAKLSNGMKERDLLHNILIALGTVSCILSLFLIDRNDYDLSFLSNPFTIGVVALVVFFFYLKILPGLNFMIFSPAYHENAKEIKEAENKQ